MTQQLFELAIVILLAGVLGVIARFFKQPVILAYLLTGIIISAFAGFHLATAESFRLFSDLGIMFLLFLVGLELNYSSVRLVGGVALMLGVSQIILTFFLGFLLAGVFNFGFFPAAYIALALTFSSTIVVVKLLSDTKDLQSLYGKLTVGLLVVQDIVAIFVLLFLGGIESGINQTQFAWTEFGFTFLKGVLLFGVMVFLGKRIIPKFFERIGRSEELLFLLSLAWLFVTAALVSRIGFSIEIAGFLAGFALANSSEHFQIAAKMRPLRDFFILGFFVFLGASIGISHFAGFSWPMFGFLGFVLLVKPLIVLAILFIFGYRKRTSFMTAISISQVSEFSFVLMALGTKLNHIDEKVAAIVSIVGAFSILLSSYFVTHSEKIYSVFASILSFLERKKMKEHHLSEENLPKPIILIGCHRTGESILLSLPRDSVCVVDFDPDVIHHLKRLGVSYVFGDIGDEEVFEKSYVSQAMLVISTSPKFDENEMLFSRLQKLGEKRPKFIARAETERDALALYARGVEYVLLPHFTSGQYLGKTIAIDPTTPILSTLKENDLELLRHFRE